MENKRKLVVVISHGADNEKASIAWSIANGGIKNGLDVRVFLDMIRSAVDAGTRVGACPPCLAVRGIEENDMMDHIEVVGSGFIHEALLEGAAVMNF